MMKSNRFVTFIMSLFLLFFMFVNIHADVKIESTTQLDFKGTIGAFMSFLGADKPTLTVEYYLDDIHKSDTIEKNEITHSNIIDVKRELFISLDHKKKRYTQMTFEEWRKMLQDNMKKMQHEQENDKENAPETEWSFQVDVKKTGETETIANKKTEKVIMALTVAAKAQQTDSKSSDLTTAQGKMIVTSTSWLAKNVKGQDEITAFYEKLIKKLGFEPRQDSMAEIMRKLSQSNPQLAEAMKKMQEESKNLEGVAMRNHTLYESQNLAATRKKESGSKESVEIPTSVGGLLKGFGKKVAKPEAESPNPGVLLESKTEILKYDLSPLDANIFAVPPDYKLQK